MIILSGSQTLLANYLLPLLRDEHQVCAFDAERGDIRDRVFVEQLFSEMRPTVFINCVQNGNLEECEYKREEAYNINGFVPGMIADLCNVKKTLFVQISSVFVYDCQSDFPYKETDPVNPATVYGDSKALAEKKIVDTKCDHLIVRMPHLYGKGDSFLSPFIENIKSSERITLPTSQKIMPTYAFDAALAIRTLVEKDARGIFNFGNGGQVKTKQFIYEFASRLGRKQGKDYIVNLLECDSEECLSPFDIPMNCTLSNDKISVLIGKVRQWDDALDDFIENSSEYL
jgi:dTDP-4-dehydrorhamnose reductase